MKQFNFEELGFPLRGVKVCEQFFAPIFSQRSEELFLVALVDKECLLIELLAFGGTEAEVEVGVANLFQAALNASAAGLILAHNHPSGIETPSKSDKVLTRSIAFACEALDIWLLDHLVFGSEAVFSFRQHNLV